jgi:hypothetical protein
VRLTANQFSAAAEPAKSMAANSGNVLQYATDAPVVNLPNTRLRSIVSYGLFMSAPMVDPITRPATRIGKL